MAGGKEYTLTFLIKAAADSSYEAAFSKAKQELNQFQQQINQNNSLLKDISGYEKQEAKVQSLANTLAQKQEAYQRAATAAQAAAHQDQALNDAEAKAKTAVEKANLKFTEQQQKLQQMGSALQQAGVNTDNLAGEQERLSQSTEQLKGQQEALAAQQNEQLQALAEMEQMAAEAYVVIQAVEQLGQAWEACISAASGFQYAMSATEAVSQATASEMQELTATAKEVGATTIFTATEIAQAMEFMGLAGWSAQEMIEGIPPVANLAAASGENLSRVCDIVTDSMMALGYGTEDTARFCDVLAQTARTANTNVDKMGDTLKYVSSTAGALNYSIEDVATAMAALASSGIKSGMAGTSLRNILASLADPSKEAAEALEELNIHLADAEGDAYSLDNVVAQLRAGFAGLTQEEKVHYASMIAGKRGMTGVLSLVNTTQEAYDELAETIRDCDGAAEQMAGTRLDNFQGSVIILESAFDALKTSIGEAFLPMMQSGAKELTGLTNAANGFVIQNQEIVVGATAAVAAFGAMAVGITGITAAMRIASVVFAGSFLANPAMWGALAVGASIVGLSVALVDLAAKATTASERLSDLRGELEPLDEQQALIEEYNELRDSLSETGQSAEELAATKEALAEVTAELKEQFPELLGNIDAETEEWDRNTQSILENIEAERILAATKAAPDIGEAAYDFVTARQQYTQATLEAAKAQENLNNAANAVNTSEALAQIEALKESMQQDMEAGTLEFTVEGTGDYADRIKEIEDYASAVSGTTVSFGNLADVDNWMEDYADSTYDASAATEHWAQAVVDANEEAERAKAQYDEIGNSFKDLIDFGVITGDQLREYGIQLSEIGITSEEIGRQVATGVLTAEEACNRYGITMSDVRHHVQVYSNAVSRSAETTEASAESAEMSYRRFLSLTSAISAVSTETLTADQAAVVFGVDLEALNVALEEQEAYEKNVADAVAVVDGGFLDAGTAAERFGVSLEAMDAYRAQAELESLEEELEELQEAYDKAYESALSSIQGQGSLLEGLSLDAERTKLTIDDALGNMQEIESYWSTYTSNMEALQGYGLSTDFLTRYCDTSADGVANTTDLANELGSLSTEDAQARVEELNSQFQAMVEQEQTTASATAELETQYTATAAAIEQRMAELESQVAADMNAMVASMNKSGQAYSAGSATAAAYASGIRSQIASIRAAAAAASAAGQISSSGYSGGKAHGGFTHGPELAGEDPRYPVEAVISFNPQYREENIGYVRQAAAMLGMNVESEQNQSAQTADWSGYEYGGLTEYGSAVLQELNSYSTAERTPEAPVYIGSAGSGGGSIQVNYSPTLQVASGTTREELIAMLHEYDEQLADKLMEFKSDMERRERRTQYA